MGRAAAAGAKVRNVFPFVNTAGKQVLRAKLQQAKKGILSIQEGCKAGVEQLGRNVHLTDMHGLPICSFSIRIPQK